MDDTLTIILISVSIVVYLVLNVVGTFYYRKLAENKKPQWLWSVVLGWLLCPFFNLSSPIVYSQS